jgi:hypothetical protein
MVFMTIFLIALAVVAIVATVHTLATDGYGRVRTAPIHRDEEQHTWH